MDEDMAVLKWFLVFFIKMQIWSRNKWQIAQLIVLFLHVKFCMDTDEWSIMLSILPAAAAKNAKLCLETLSQMDYDHLKLLLSK